MKRKDQSTSKEARADEFLASFPWQKSIGWTCLWNIVFVAFFFVAVAGWNFIIHRCLPVPDGVTIAQRYGATVDSLAFVVGMVSAWGLILALFWAIRDPVSPKPATPKPTWRRGLSTLSWAILATIMHFLLDLGCSLVASPTDPNKGLVKMGNPWLMGIFIAVVAPVLEELFFRGVMMNTLRACLLRSSHRRVRYFATDIAMVVSALIFAAMHQNPSAFLNYFGAGLVMAWAYEKTGRLSVPILAHSLHNFLSVLLTLFFGI